MAEDKNKQYVFGLDIGTRSIIGTVGYRKGDRFVVVAQRMKEHDTRSMLDGQIHDIQKVGDTIRSVKNDLEEAIGEKLSGVCIAAAGRALKTVTTHADMVMDSELEVSQEEIYALVAQGIEQAYQEFLENKDKDEDVRYYCVGHSVVRYFLNGNQMGNLEGHKARNIGVDLIATFLPDDVVDGLYKAVEVAGLSVVSLTLEPIAAIQLAIPERFRMLNIALIDVGAGTSDISITNDGCILAYGMIPMAGDAITETIAKACLVDFKEAESIKKQACEKDVVEFMDIMLLPQTVKSEEIMNITSGVIDEMSTKAADMIKELNGGKSVSAVFVVGGGGKMKGYTEAVAEKLGIQKERVAIRGEEVMQNITFEEEVVKDSVLVTPIGICLNYYEQSNNFIFVSFNNSRIKMYDNNNLTVGDVAMQAQFPNDSLFPKRGKALSYTVNGRARIQRGMTGEPAKILLNGNEVDLHASVRENDVIVVEESTAGEKATVMIGDLPESKEFISITVNDKRVEFPKFAEVNGVLQSAYYEINEGDRVEILEYYTVGQIAEFMDVILANDMNIYVNNQLSDRSTPVYENFSVHWTLEVLPNPKAEWKEYKQVETVDSYENLPEEEIDDAVYENTDSTASDKSDLNKKTEELAEESVEEKAEQKISVKVNGDIYILTGKSEYVFVDVFELIDFDLSQPKGKSIITNLNDRPAQYMEPINEGDVIEIRWEG